MATLQVKITANADDGNEVVGSYLITGEIYAGWATGWGEFIAFFRFLNVTVPQGATVSAATLTLGITYIDGTPNTTLYGVDEDNAAAFADPGNLPSAATKTTASADPDPAGTGTKVITITTIVQEIVDRAGWASGNAMAFVVDDNAGSGVNIWGAEDYGEAGTAEATLDITYTEPNTAPTITSGPTTTYASGTCTTPTVTWGVTFTATDSEQTGADALTYYIRTSSTFGAGTQVATGTCTSGASKVVTGLAYNASGVVEGTQTLYLHIYDGALNTVTASSFTLVRRFIKSVAGTGGTLSGALSKSSIYSRAVAGAISSISGALSRVTGKALTGISGGITGVLAKNTNKAVTGVFGLLSASLTRTTQKALLGISGSLSGITSGVKIAVIELVGVVSSLSGTVTFSLVFGKALAGSISSITGGISKTISKSLSGALGSLAASIAKSTVKSFSGTAGVVSGTVSKLTSLILVGTASTISGSLTIGVGYTKALTGELLSITGNVSRITLKALSGASGAVSGALSSIRIFSQVLAGEIATITGSITRFVTKSFSGVITGSGILSTASSFYRTVAGSLSSLSGEFSFKNIIRRVKMKGGSVVRSVISGGSRILR